MEAPHGIWNTDGIQNRVVQILVHIIAIPVVLWISVAHVGHYLKNQNREFQNVVVISGVMASFQAVRRIDTDPYCNGREFPLLEPECRRFGGPPMDESGYTIVELRVQLQGDPSRYVVNDWVFEGFDWENFHANEAVGNRVSLMVEGAELMGRAKRVRVIGLTSRLGTYLTPEVSLSLMRDADFFFLLIGSLGGVYLLYVLWSFSTWIYPHK